MNFEDDIEQCIRILHEGGIILYPTDTIWGIGCDAKNQQAINKIFALKKRAESKSMIILLANKADIFKYVDNPESKILNYISTATKPTTAIYQKGKNVSEGLISEDGSIAIRVTNEAFCAALLDYYGGPIVSTSANISGSASPANFDEISIEIKNGVDYIVQHRQNDIRVAKPSAIIKINEEKKIVVVRS